MTDSPDDGPVAAEIPARLAARVIDVLVVIAIDVVGVPRSSNRPARA